MRCKPTHSHAHTYTCTLTHTHTHTHTHTLARLQHLNNTDSYFGSRLSKPTLGIVSSRRWMNWLSRQVSWDWYMTKHNKTRQSKSLFSIVYVSIIADFTDAIAWRCCVAYKQKLVRPRLSNFNYLHARKRWVGRSRVRPKQALLIIKVLAAPQLVRTMCVLLQTKIIALWPKSSSKQPVFRCTMTNMIRSHRPHSKPVHGNPML